MAAARCTHCPCAAGARPVSTPLRQFAIAVLALVGAVTGGWLIAHLSMQEDMLRLWLPLMVASGGMILAVFFLRPVYVAMLYVGFAFINPTLIPTLLDIGGVSVRSNDLLTLLLIGILAMRIVLYRQPGPSQTFWRVCLPFAPWLLWIGISLATVALNQSSILATALISYLRLVMTAGFAVLLHLVLRTRSECLLLHRTLITIAVLSILIGSGMAIWKVGLSGLVTSSDTHHRFGGLIGFNTFGLVAGLLVVYAVICWRTAPWSSGWMLFLLLGLCGLFLSRSASSTFATAGTSAICLAWRRSGIALGRVWSTRLVVGMPLLSLALITVWMLRRDAVQGLFDLSAGSFAHRVVIATASLRIFLEHPIIGVGWQASSTAAVIGSRELNADLLYTFPNIPYSYVFLASQTSVHNMYLQFLVELGVIGLGLFVLGCFSARRAIRTILHNGATTSAEHRPAMFAAYSLVFLLIWWNTNPLFGGQTESILASVFLGLLASLGSLDAYETSSVPEP